MRQFELLKMFEKSKTDPPGHEFVGPPAGLASPKSAKLLLEQELYESLVKCPHHPTHASAWKFSEF